VKKRPKKRKKTFQKRKKKATQLKELTMQTTKKQNIAGTKVQTSKV